MRISNTSAARSRSRGHRRPFGAIPASASGQHHAHPLPPSLLSAARSAREPHLTAPLPRHRVAGLQQSQYIRRPPPGTSGGRRQPAAGRTSGPKHERLVNLIGRRSSRCSTRSTRSTPPIQAMMNSLMLAMGDLDTGGGGSGRRRHESPRVILSTCLIVVVDLICRLIAILRLQKNLSILTQNQKDFTWFVDTYCSLLQPPWSSSSSSTVSTCLYLPSVSGSP